MDDYFLKPKPLDLDQDEKATFNTLRQELASKVKVPDYVLQPLQEATPPPPRGKSRRLTAVVALLMIGAVAVYFAKQRGWINAARFQRVGQQG